MPEPTALGRAAATLRAHADQVDATRTHSHTARDPVSDRLLADAVMLLHRAASLAEDAAAEEDGQSPPTSSSA